MVACKAACPPIAAAALDPTSYTLHPKPAHRGCREGTGKLFMMPLQPKKRAQNAVQGTPLLSVLARHAESAHAVADLEAQLAARVEAVAAAAAARRRERGEEVQVGGGWGRRSRSVGQRWRRRQRRSGGSGGWRGEVVVEGWGEVGGGLAGWWAARGAAVAAAAAGDMLYNIPVGPLSSHLLQDDEMMGEEKGWMEDGGEGGSSKGAAAAAAAAAKGEEGGADDDLLLPEQVQRLPAGVAAGGQLGTTRAQRVKLLEEALDAG